MPVALHSNQSNDFELLTKQFHYADPRVAFKLLPSVPPSAKMAAIVASYENRPDKIPCARPRCGTPHNKGFVVLLDIGEHIIIGHVCGKKVFGTNFDHHKKEHVSLLDRQRLLERKQRFLTSYPNIIQILRSWRYEANNVQNTRREFGKFVPELFTELQRRTSRGGTSLTISVKLDRPTLEVMRQAQAAAGRRASRLSSEREEIIHHLKGEEFFGPTPLRDLLEKALTKLDTAFTKLDSGGLPNYAMQQALRQVTSATGELRHFVRLHAAAREALSNENLVGIVNWWSRFQNNTAIDFRKGTLIIPSRRKECRELIISQISPLDRSVIISLES